MTLAYARFEITESQLSKSSVKTTIVSIDDISSVRVYQPGDMKTVTDRVGWGGVADLFRGTLNTQIDAKRFIFGGFKHWKNPNRIWKIAAKSFLDLGEPSEEFHIFTPPLCYYNDSREAAARRRLVFTPPLDFDHAPNMGVV